MGAVEPADNSKKQKSNKTSKNVSIIGSKRNSIVEDKKHLKQKLLHSNTMEQQEAISKKLTVFAKKSSGY